MLAPRARMILALVVPLTVASSALADGGSPDAAPPLSQSLTGAAKDAFDSADLLMNNQDSRGALLKFSQAYELSKDPRLLYDMAICEKNLHHYARMRALLEQYERVGGVTLTPTMQINVDHALQAVDNLVGALTLAVSEAGATVSVDGEVVGVAPLGGPVIVDLGQHVVSVHKDGFDTVDRRIDVAGGNALSLDVPLSRPSAGRYLTVHGDGGATIFIDGTIVAVGHFSGSLSPGGHTVVVTEPGKHPYTSDVELREGEARSLDVTLEPLRRRALLPWIIGAAAVAVAGATVGGYFLFKSSGAASPSAPPPGQLGTVNFSSLWR